MNELEQLQFTEEEIDHAVKQLTTLAGWPGNQNAASVVRAVLRAVRAVPARCLNGHLAGNPAHRGAQVQGTGVNGVVVRGTVETSYPVTTVVRQPDGELGYLWTNTIHSWDPSTEPLRERMEQHFGLPTMVTEDVPPGTAWVLPPEMLRADDGMVVEVDW